jgi:hypothetical protein
MYLVMLSQKVQLKQKVADAFLDRFQLKPHEAEALKNSRNEPITEVHTNIYCTIFCTTLHRVKNLVIVYDLINAQSNRYPAPINTLPIKQSAQSNN